MSYLKCELLNPGTTEEQCDLVRELEEELAKEGIDVWFEELNIKEGELESFVYGVEAEGEKEYVKCVVSDEYNEEVEKFKEELGVEGGVFVVFK